MGLLLVEIPVASGDVSDFDSQLSAHYLDFRISHYVSPSDAVPWSSPGQ